MKRRLFKVLLPITTLLLSSCSFLDWAKSFFNRGETKEVIETEEKQKEEPVTPTPSGPDYSGYPTKIELPYSLPMTIGQTKELVVNYTPADVINKEITWTCTNKSVLEVNNGSLTALSAGHVKVTATTKNTNGESISSTCDVYVSDPSLIDKQKLLYTYDDFTSNTYYPEDNTPLEGNSKLLIIPIWFSDSDTFINLEKREDIRSDIEKAFLGSNEETGWRSVKTYYEEESKGILSLTGTVTDWYELSDGYETFKTYDTGLGLTASLVETAADAYFSTHSSDSRFNYDTNNDGYLDGVMLIYAAPDYDNLGDEQARNLWAYKSCLYKSASKDNPQPNIFFWGSYDFMYSYGNDASSRTGNAPYGRGDTRFCNVDAHCFIHEMGHALGLNDYYDYSNQHNPSGGFSMQDYNVGGHDPFSVMALGWAEPYIPTSSMTITINDFQSSHDVILLANHEVNSPFDEYLLLELFSPSGLNEHDSAHAYNFRYPKGPNTLGIRLWHVDARLTRWDGHDLVTDLITDPTKGNVFQAFSNTYYSSTNPESNGYISTLGKSYSDYNILQLIRYDGYDDNLNERSFFSIDSTFKMSDYSSQFVKGPKMNDGKYLGWSFTVNAIDESSASITVKKV